MAWNVQSICNKIYEVLSILSDNDIDIACISETWLSEEKSQITAIIKQHGFQIKHIYREKRGAGVAIIWKNSLEKLFKIKCDFKTKTFNTFQYINICICDSIKINLVCLYRHQEESTNLFIENLEKLLSSWQTSGNSIILVGDFNFHFEKLNNTENESLENLLNSFGLKQFVQGPTHTKGHTLDLVWANEYEYNFPVIQPKSVNLSDHFPVIFNIPTNSTNVVSDSKVSYRCTKSIDTNLFKSNLHNSLCNIDISDMAFVDHLKVYSDTVLCEFDKVAPLKTSSSSPSSSEAPWMDREFKDCRSTRRKLERRWRRTRLESDKNIYVSKRVECAELSKCKRSTYYGKIISDHEGDQRSLFKVVSNLLDKSKSSVFPQHENPKDLATSFNEFYLQRVQNIRDNIPVSKHKQNTDAFLGTVLESFKPTTEVELRKIIMDKGIKTSPDDVLPANVLKEVIEELLPHICKLVNKSLETGSVEGLKDSIIVPILKKSGLNPEVLKNYRPVSNLISVGLLTEKVVKVRFMEHIKTNNLNTNEQHGYKQFHSTETLLLQLVNDILLGFDSGFLFILILIDMSAAFDTVDVDELLFVLEHEIGIKGIALKWFKSFLVGRTQRVKVGNTISDPLPVLFGVPQGSVLGPILFNIYTRSLYKLIQNLGFKTSGYADDNNAYQSFALRFQHNMITTQLPNLMEQISQWMNSHFLKINPDKTEILLFSPENFKDSHTINGAFIADKCIRFSSVARNLGFNLDRFLNMNFQVNEVVSLGYKMLADVGRIRKFLSCAQTELLIHAVVHSRIDYCNVLLIGINKNEINKLQRLQNTAARMIAGLRKRDSVRHILNDLHWLRVEERVIFKLLVFVYKCIHGLAPGTMSDLISFRNPETKLLNLIYLKSQYGRRSFSYCAPRYWNSLPHNVRSADTLSSFKRMTKYTLFNDFNSYINDVFKYLN